MYHKITQEEMDQIRECHKYLEWFEQEAGNRDFTTAELKRVIDSRKHIEKSIPQLLGTIERLRFIIRQDHPDLREG